ncbi:pectin acetylesterase [Aureococcus anophagefferens]|nr:pectin acetylesterase [Aureococcus anophagefferens]
MMSRIDGQPARPALLCALASVLAAATAPDPRVTVPSGASRADAPRVEAAARDGLARAVPLVGYDRARCLDGSPGRYYVDVYGDNTKIYVHLQGGGFCGSLGACANRSRTPLGSTRPDVPGAWGPTLDLAAERPYFSRNATRNPLLADFTHVFVVYCDGAYFAGNVADPAPEPGGDSLFFRGRAILDAVVADLDLAGATDVILGGCSAGGIATFLHLDAVAASLRAIAPNAAVAGFADSGCYADVPYYTNQKRFPSRRRT